MQRQRRKLTVEDRVAIDLRRKDGWGVRAIARELGRSPSVISTEIGRGREPGGTYAAGPAQAAAAARRDRSGRRARLAPDSPLFAEVAKLLRLQWSPEQIAGRRKRLEEGTEVSSGLRVSHEAIYQAIYAVPRGELRRELLACLRQGKPQRGRRPRDGERRGRICDMTSIRERPAEVEERLVPGHWEGDLIKGAGNRSSVGTLVERTSRKLVLIKLTDAKAETARDGFAAGLLAVPAPLRLTLTYDQGKEMARHKELGSALNANEPVFTVVEREKLDNLLKDLALKADAMAASLASTALEQGLSVGLYAYSDGWVGVNPARGKRHRRDVLAVLARSYGGPRPSARARVRSRSP